MMLGHVLATSRRAPDADGAGLVNRVDAPPVGAVGEDDVGTAMGLLGLPFQTVLLKPGLSATSTSSGPRPARRPIEDDRRLRVPHRRRRWRFGMSAEGWLDRRSALNGDATVLAASVPVAGSAAWARAGTNRVQAERAVPGGGTDAWPATLRPPGAREARQPCRACVASASGLESIRARARALPCVGRAPRGGRRAGGTKLGGAGVAAGSRCRERVGGCAGPPGADRAVRSVRDPGLPLAGRAVGGAGAGRAAGPRLDGGAGGGVRSLVYG